jgi:hypothetical protein
MLTMELSQIEQEYLLDTLNKSKSNCLQLISESKEWLTMGKGAFAITYKEMYTEHRNRIERLELKIKSIESIISKLLITN